MYFKYKDYSILIDEENGIRYKHKDGNLIYLTEDVINKVCKYAAPIQLYFDGYNIELVYYISNAIIPYYNMVNGKTKNPYIRDYIRLGDNNNIYRNVFVWR